MRWRGARAVVTGGASGLGLVVSERRMELAVRVVVLAFAPLAKLVTE